MDGEVSLQRIQLQYRVTTTSTKMLSFDSLMILSNLKKLHLWFRQHETELLEDSLALPGFQPTTTTSYKFGSSDDEYMDSDDHTSARVRTRPSFIPNSRFTNSNLNASQPGGIKQEVRRRHSHNGWLHKLVETFSYNTF